jgi:hypothetical protein
LKYVRIFVSKIEFVDRSNFYCTGKLLPNFDMQKWGEKKTKIAIRNSSPNSPDFEGEKSKSRDGAVGSKEYRRI